MCSYRELNPKLVKKSLPILFSSLFIQNVSQCTVLKFVSTQKCCMSKFGAYTELTFLSFPQGDSFLSPRPASADVHCYSVKIYTVIWTAEVMLLCCGAALLHSVNRRPAAFKCCRNLMNWMKLFIHYKADTVRIIHYQIFYFLFYFIYIFWQNHRHGRKRHHSHMFILSTKLRLCSHHRLVMVHVCQWHVSSCGMNRSGLKLPNMLRLI